MTDTEVLGRLKVLVGIIEFLEAEGKRTQAAEFYNKYRDELDDHKNAPWFRRMVIRAAGGTVTDGLEAADEDPENLKHVRKLHNNIVHLLDCITGADGMERPGINCEKILSEYKKHAAQAAILVRMDKSGDDPEQILSDGGLDECAAHVMRIFPDSAVADDEELLKVRGQFLDAINTCRASGENFVLTHNETKTPVEQLEATITSLADEDERDKLLKQIKKLVQDIHKELGRPELLELAIRDIELSKADAMLPQMQDSDEEEAAAPANGVIANGKPKRKPPARRQDSEDGEESESDSDNDKQDGPDAGGGKSKTPVRKQPAQNGKRRAGPTELPSPAKKLKDAREKGAAVVNAGGSTVQHALAYASPVPQPSMVRRGPGPAGESPTRGGVSESREREPSPDRGGDKEPYGSQPDNGEEAQGDGVNITNAGEKRKEPEKDHDTFSYQEEEEEQPPKKKKSRGKGKEPAPKKQKGNGEEDIEEFEDDAPKKPKKGKGKGKAPITKREVTDESPGQEMQFSEDENGNRKASGVSKMGKVKDLQPPFWEADLKKEPKKRRPWSADEVENLRKGVLACGAGSWSQILKTQTFDNRSAVDLKDKWRNMIKKDASLTMFASNQGGGSSNPQAAQAAPQIDIVHAGAQQQNTTQGAPAHAQNTQNTNTGGAAANPQNVQNAQHAAENAPQQNNQDQNGGDAGQDGRNVVGI